MPHKISWLKKTLDESAEAAQNSAIMTNIGLEAFGVAKAAGISQEAFCLRAGIHLATLKRIANGTTEGGNVRTIKRIQNVIDELKIEIKARDKDVATCAGKRKELGGDVSASRPTI